MDSAASKVLSCGCDSVAACAVLSFGEDSDVDSAASNVLSCGCDSVAACTVLSFGEDSDVDAEVFAALSLLVDSTAELSSVASGAAVLEHPDNSNAAAQRIIDAFLFI
ncbi:MAG: hypothetical protein ACI4KM_03060 [Oscillospiraceae bacterium]